MFFLFLHSSPRSMDSASFSLLPEKPPPDGFVSGEVGSIKEMIRYACWVLRNQGQRLSPPRIRLGAELIEHLPYPIGHAVNRSIRLILRFRVCMSRGVPVIVAEQLVAQQTHASERQ